MPVRVNVIDERERVPGFNCREKAIRVQRMDRYGVYRVALERGKLRRRKNDSFSYVICCDQLFPLSKYLKNGAMAQIPCFFNARNCRYQKVGISEHMVKHMYINKIAWHRI